MARKSSATSLYSIHPSIAYANAIVQGMPAKTGKSIQEWMKIVKKDGPGESKEIVAFLKEKYKLGGTTASMIADAALGRADDVDPDVYMKAAPGYVEAMYAGGKAGLRPIHDALIELARSLAPDVKICPCQTIVPFYRNHVFAQIKPATQTRIDFGYALKGCPRKLSPRLLDTGGLKKGDRITHRIPLESVKDIDADVKDWLKTAYDMDGKE